MYVPENVGHFDVANARRFVEFWSKPYEDTTKILGEGGRINYLEELNLWGDLTEQNVRRLLRWKDARLLTDTILSGPNEGQANPRVAKVLEHLHLLNDFRRGGITEADMWSKTEEIFESGIVWRIFLFHIAKPHIYPIADTNVFEAWAFHKNEKKRAEATWETYSAYRKYFGEIASALGIAETAENADKLKSIDNALVVFGAFLKFYKPEASQGVYAIAAVPAQ